MNLIFQMTSWDRSWCYYVLFNKITQGTVASGGHVVCENLAEVLSRAVYSSREGRGRKMWILKQQLRNSTTMTRVDYM